ncbi:hypothetical protein V8C86DRAFT_3149451, partial [Haematococcus lacustris]
MSGNEGSTLRQGLGTPLGGSRPLVDAQLVFDHVLERVHAELGQLVATFGQLSDAHRGQSLLAYLHSSRQQLLRLLSLLQWHPKAKALAECVAPGKVLDMARQHSQLLESAALEMFEGHARRQPDFSPLFDVPTALEILSRGSYTELPYSIEQLVPAPQQLGRQQEARLRRVRHMIHSYLLKAQLPPGVSVAGIGPGYVVLRAPGLYEARLTLVPAPHPPPRPAAPPAPPPPPQGPPEAASQGASALHSLPPAQAGAGHSRLGAAAAGSPEAPVVEGRVGVGGGGGVQGGGGGGDEGEVSSGPPPQRWRWLLLGFILPAGTAQREPLHPSQVSSLLQDLNHRLLLAADAAVYAQQDTAAAAAATAAAQLLGSYGEAGEGGGAAAAGSPPAATPGMSSQHPASTGPAPSGLMAAASVRTASGTTGGVGGPVCCAAGGDERSAPLAVMHSVLSDLGGRLLLDAVRGTASGLVEAGGAWAGHAQLQPVPKGGLQPGLRLVMWTQAVPLVPYTAPRPPPTSEGLLPRGDMKRQGPGGGGGGGGGEGGGGEGGGGHPCVDIGLDARGRVQVVLWPPVPLGQQQQGGGGLGDRPPSLLVVPQRPTGQQQGEGEGEGEGAVPGNAAGAVPEGVGAAAELQGSGSGGQGVGQGSQGLQLDARTVNVDEVLLRAAAAVAHYELSQLQEQLGKVLLDVARLTSHWELRLVCSPLPWTPLSASTQDTATASKAAGAIGVALTQQTLPPPPPPTPAPDGPLPGPSQAPDPDPGLGLGPARPPGPCPEARQVLAPMLQFWCEGQLLLLVGRSLITGRLLLQPGPGLALDTQLDSLHSWKQKEEELNSQLHKQYHQHPGSGTMEGGPHPPGPAGGSSSAGGPAASFLSQTSAALRVLRELRLRLCHLCRDQQRQLAVTYSLFTACRLQLQLGLAGKQLLHSFVLQNPWVDLQRHFAVWSFPHCPLPPATPLLLMFYLAADHPGVRDALFTLLVMAVSPQQLPLRLLAVIQ